MPAANDHLDAALAISGASGTTVLDFTGADYMEPDEADWWGGTPKSLWLRWTCPADDNYAFVLGDGAPAQWWIAVAADAPDFATWSGEYMDWGANYGSPPPAFVAATAGTDYLIAVWDYSYETGSAPATAASFNWSLAADYVPPPPPYAPPQWSGHDPFFASDSYYDFTNFGTYQPFDQAPNSNKASGLVQMGVYPYADIDLVTFNGGYSTAPYSLSGGLWVQLPDPAPPELTSGPVTVRATDPATGHHYFATSPAWFFLLEPEPGYDDTLGWRDLPSASASLSNPSRSRATAIWAPGAPSGPASSSTTSLQISATPTGLDAAYVLGVVVNLDSQLPDDRYALGDYPTFIRPVPSIPDGLRGRDGDPWAGPGASRLSASGDPWAWQREAWLDTFGPDSPNVRPTFPYTKHAKSVDAVSFNIGFVTQEYRDAYAASRWDQDLQVWIVPPSSASSGTTWDTVAPGDYATEFVFAVSLPIPTADLTAFNATFDVPASLIAADGSVTLRVAFSEWVDGVTAAPPALIYGPYSATHNVVYLAYATSEALSESSGASTFLHHADVDYAKWGYRYWIGRPGVVAPPAIAMPPLAYSRLLTDSTQPTHSDIGFTRHLAMGGGDIGFTRRFSPNAPP